MSRKTSAKEARTMAFIRKKLVEPGVPRCPGDKHTMVWVRRNGGGPDHLTCCPRCRDGPREAGGIMRLKMTVTNLTNKVALYNFLSTFSGTHFVSPRAYQAELGWTW